MGSMGFESYEKKGRRKRKTEGEVKRCGEEGGPTSPNDKHGET